jgi:hypothetical protein
MALPATAAAAPAPYIPWPDALPGLPTVSNPQPAPSQPCTDLKIDCVNGNLARLTKLQNELGCNHLGIFAATYRITTLTLRNTLVSGNPHFADPAWGIGFDAAFHNYYFNALSSWQAGKSVPGAWRVAFQVATRGDANATVDLILGINAHVQRDLPFALATEGLHTRSGASRKHDWDQYNIFLARAYGPIVQYIAAHYDPTVSLTNPDTLLDGETAVQIFSVWREEGFRNAERLLDARTPAQRRAVTASINANATKTAEAIAAAPTAPGYRLVRDAYCASHNG